MARKRRKPPARPGRSDGPPPPVGLTLAICRSAREQLAMPGTKAIDAEVWASQVVGSIAWEIRFPDDRAHALALLVDELGSVPRPGAREALHALAAVGQAAFGERAAGAARRIGGPPPRWAAEAGSGSARSAWHVTDPHHDDGTTYAIEIARPSGRHVLCVYVDNNLGAIPKDAFLLTSLEAFTKPFREAGSRDLVLAELPVADAIGAVRAAVERGRIFIDRPSSDDLRDLDALVEGHLRFLPEGLVLDAEETPGEEERAALAEAFLASPEGRPHRRGDDPDVLQTLLWFGGDYNVGGPLRWSPVVVELFLADWVGRKVVADRRYIARIPVVLRAFVRYAGRVRGVPDDRVAETLAAIEQWAPELIAQGGASSPFANAEALARSLLGEAALGPEERLVSERLQAAAPLRYLRGPRPDDDLLAAAAAALRAATGPDRALRIALREVAGRQRLPPEADRALLLVAGAYASRAGLADALGEAEGVHAELSPDDWLRIAQVALDGRISAAQIGRRLAGSHGLVALRSARERAAIGAEIIAGWQLAGALDADGALTPLGDWLIPAAIAYVWGLDFGR